MHAPLDLDNSIYSIFPPSEYSETLLININTSVEFTGIKRILLNHNGSNFIWVSGSRDFLPYIVAPLKNDHYLEPFLFSKDIVLDSILEYLSLLSARFGLSVEMHSDTFKNYLGKMKYVLNYLEPWIPRHSQVTHEFETIPLYSAGLDQNESLMVALFRDGVSSSNIFYSILSFFKIFESHFPDFTDRNLWIDRNFSAAKQFAVKSNVIRGLGDWDKFNSFVQLSGFTRGEYLYKKGRLAIAHANKNPMVNPNVYADYYEMYFSREVLKILSWYLVLQKLDQKLLA